MIKYSGLRIHPSNTAPEPSKSQIITVVAHLSLDRLNRLSTMIHRLNALTTRVSAAIFIPNQFLGTGMGAEWSNITLARREINLQLGCKGGRNALSSCSHVDVHLVYGETVDISHASCEDGRLPPSRCLFYPIQELRNIATSMVMTPWMVSIDIDFIPSSPGFVSKGLA